MFRFLLNYKKILANIELNKLKNWIIYWQNLRSGRLFEYRKYRKECLMLGILI